MSLTLTHAVTRSEVSALTISANHQRLIGQKRGRAQRSQDMVIGKEEYLFVGTTSYNRAIRAALYI